MRIDPNEAMLVAVDFQEKLMPSIVNGDVVLKKSEFLIRGLKELNIPMFMTTQYSQGLGLNVQSIRELIGDENNFDKTSFGIYQDEAVKEYIDKQKKKFIIIAGIETHICVLQSLTDLASSGYIPILAVDCTSARSSLDVEIGLKRAEKEGVMLSTSESLIYELAASSKHPNFKNISKLVKEQSH